MEERNKKRWTIRSHGCESYMPLFKSFVRRRRRRRFLLSRWFIELNRRRLHFLPSFHFAARFLILLCSISLSRSLYFHYSLSIPSSRQPLMMKTQSSIYKILSRSLSFCVPQLDGERGTFFFLLAHPKSSQKGDEKIPHQTSSSFTSFYHRLSENSKRPPEHVPRFLKMRRLFSFLPNKTL